MNIRPSVLSVLLIVIAQIAVAAVMQSGLLLLGVSGPGVQAQGEGVPAGAIVFVDAGACPTGYTEQSGASARMIVGTTNGAANVGTTGGADDITPAGTVAAPTFTGSALSTHAHATGTYATSAHSGTAVDNHASHTHFYTEVPNHVHPVERFPTATGGSTGFTVDTSMSGTPTNTSQNTANPTGGVAQGTTAGPSATLTHAVTQPSAHTLSGSSEAISAGTPAGTNSAPAFTGTQFDNRSAFIRMIPCQKD